jgi:aspartyl/asparaginyl-tRNA synthetase
MNVSEEYLKGLVEDALKDCEKELGLLSNPSGNQYSKLDKEQILELEWFNLGKKSAYEVIQKML